MTDWGRREFLRLLGITGTSVAFGCARPRSPLLAPREEEDIVPGVATWYATTCRECPAGCGLLAKNREGRVIKVEGNPLHPVNTGKLCARGQSSLHGLYNPDRFRGPARRNRSGELEAITWAEAEATLCEKLEGIVRDGRGDRVVFLTELVNGMRRDFLARWLSAFGQTGGPTFYEPFAYEPLRTANRAVFGYAGIPTYRIDRSDFLVSFGAGFLETWLSNVQYARQFAAFHALGPDGKKPFVYVGPRLSMTANSADLWVPVPPEGEVLAALGMLRVIVDEGLVPDLARDRRDEIAVALGDWSLPEIAGRIGASEEVLRIVARGFAAAERPLALAEGLGLSGPNATETAAAANLLCTLKPGTWETIDFSARSSYSDVTPARAVGEMLGRMDRGETDLLLVHQANPVFSLPLSWRAADKIRRVPFVVSFSSAPDETTELAHLVLPAHTPLESWGDYSPQEGVVGLVQPTMGALLGTRQLEDALASVAQRALGPDRFPARGAYEALREQWVRAAEGGSPGDLDEVPWHQALARGGIWGRTAEARTERRTPRLTRPVFSAPMSEPASTSGVRFTTYPTVQFFDGRQANRLWVQELPDPMSMMTWDGWVEVHPETAARLGLERGDVVRLRSEWGSVDVPALPLPTVPPGTIAMPIGQGHTQYGRFATHRPANPMHLFPPGIDGSSQGLAGPPVRVAVERTGKAMLLAHTDGSQLGHGRDLVQSISLREAQEALAAGKKGEVVPPLPDAYDSARGDWYPPHQHKEHRWCMAVDLDRCIGCSACVVACYAENNVAVVGKEQVLKGREMAWLRIQRYFEEGEAQARWLPMLCQQCDSAPCESVCPVYAPNHSSEGLNNQVYNRCIGTRFCLQNDPYKVRRFNYFGYTRAKLLEYQLNPDVTVRQKGVMEKCSFCIQRIVEAKAEARNEGRKVRDGDFTTACAQTCPTDTLIFGDLLDPKSRVSRLIQDARAYQVLAHFNTKPAVIYLKRVTGVIGA